MMIITLSIENIAKLESIMMSVFFTREIWLWNPWLIYASYGKVDYIIQYISVSIVQL